MTTADKTMTITTTNVISINWAGNSGIVGDGEAVTVTFDVVVGVAVGTDVGAAVGADVGAAVGADVGADVGVNVAVMVWVAWTLLKVYDGATATEEPSTVKEAME